MSGLDDLPHCPACGGRGWRLERCDLCHGSGACPYCVLGWGTAGPCALHRRHDIDLSAAL